jgi:hypothetical protein
MLDEHAAHLARDRIQLEIAEQHGRIRADIEKAKREFASRGVLRSGMFVLRVVEICSAATADRAQFAWRSLRNIIAASGIAYYDGLADDLKTFLLDFFPEELDVNGYVVQESQFVTNDGMLNEMKTRMGAARSAAVARARGDIDLYVLSLKNSRASSEKLPGMTTVHVHPHAAVGAIQMGAGSTAHVTQNIDAQSKAQVLEALAKVEESLTRIESLTPEAKSDVAETILDAKRELSKERPNSVKLGGLLSGVSTVIGAVADMKPAYDNFKMVVAASLGLLFP